MNKLIPIYLVICIAACVSCSKTKLQQNFTEADINAIIDEFSELRLQHQLFAKQRIPSNKEILQMAIQKQNADEIQVLKILRQERPALVEKILAWKVVSEDSTAKQSKSQPK